MCNSISTSAKEEHGWIVTCAARQAPPSDDAPGLNNGYTLLYTHMFYTHTHTHTHIHTSQTASLQVNIELVNKTNLFKLNCIIFVRMLYINLSFKKTEQNKTEQNTWSVNNVWCTNTIHVRPQPFHHHVTRERQIQASSSNWSRQWPWQGQVKVITNC